MESNIMELNSKRRLILEDILKEVRSWDGTYEMGIAIIENIELGLEELKTINASLEAISGSLPFDEAYRETMVVVVEEYENLLEKLEIERSKLLELIKETKLRDNIKHSYILKDKESIFIDKDL